MPKYLPSERRKEFLAGKQDICALCGLGALDETVGLDPGDPAYDPWTVDHVITRSEGGSNSFDNLTKTHELCNMIRGARHQLSVLEGRREALNRPPIADERLYRVAHIAKLTNAGVDILTLYREPFRNFDEQDGETESDKESIAS